MHFADSDVLKEDTEKSLPWLCGGARVQAEAGEYFSKTGSLHLYNVQYSAAANVHIYTLYSTVQFYSVMEFNTLSRLLKKNWIFEQHMRNMWS